MSVRWQPSVKPCSSPISSVCCSIEVDDISSKQLNRGMDVRNDKIVLISLVHLLPVSHRQRRDVQDIGLHLGIVQDIGLHFRPSPRPRWNFGTVTVNSYH